MPCDEGIKASELNSPYDSNILYSTVFCTLLYATLRDLLTYSTLNYMELFYSGVQEAVEVVKEPRNSTLFIDHFLCQVYLLQAPAKRLVESIKQLASTTFEHFSWDTILSWGPAR